MDTLTPIRQYKKQLIAIELLFLMVFAAEIFMLRSSGQHSPSPNMLGLFLLPPLGATFAFLPLWYLSWFGSDKLGRAQPSLKVFFWLVVALCVFIWSAVYATFVL